MSWTNVLRRAATLACLGLASCGPANGSPQHPAGHDASDAALGGAGGAGAGAAGAGGDGSTMPPISFESPRPPTCDPRLLAASRLCESNVTSCPVSTGLTFNCRGSVEHVDMFAASDIDVYFAVNVASTDGNPEVPRAHAVFLIERHGDEIALSPGPTGLFCRVRLLAGETVLACDSDTRNASSPCPTQTAGEPKRSAKHARAGCSRGRETTAQVYVLSIRTTVSDRRAASTAHARSKGSWTTRARHRHTDNEVAIGRDAASQVAVAVWTPDGELQISIYTPRRRLSPSSWLLERDQLEVHPHGSGALVFTRLGGTREVPGDAGYAQHSLLPGPESFVSDALRAIAAQCDITCTTRGPATPPGASRSSKAPPTLHRVAISTRDSQAHVSTCSPTCSCTSQTLARRRLDEIVIRARADVRGRAG